MSFEEFFTRPQSVPHGNGPQYHHWGHPFEGIDDEPLMATHIHLLRSSAELLESGCDWGDLCGLLRRFGFVWLTRDVYLFYLRADPEYFLYDEEHRGGHTFHLRLVAATDQPGSKNCSVIVCSVTEEEPTLVYQQLFQLLSKTPAERILLCPSLYEWDDEHDDHAEEPPEISDFPMSAETLASILDVSGCHKEIAFEGLRFTEQHGRELASFPGSVAFRRCSFEDDGRSLFEVMGSSHGEGLTGLEIELGPRVDTSALQNALCTTTSLRTLDIARPSPDFVPHFFNFLEQNSSLIRLDILPGEMTESQFLGIFESLRNHPTLEELSLPYIYLMDDNDLDEADTSAEACERRARVILDVVREHKTLCKLDVSTEFIDEQIVKRQVRHHLNDRVYRPRVEKLVEEEPSTCVRRRLFNRSIIHGEVNRSPSLMYMFLSGFHDVLAEVHQPEVRNEETPRVHNTRSSKKRAARNEETGCAYNTRSKKSKGG